jgi:hypothetical protein
MNTHLNMHFDPNLTLTNLDYIITPVKWFATLIPSILVINGYAQLDRDEPLDTDARLPTDWSLTIDGIQR